MELASSMDDAFTRPLSPPQISNSGFRVPDPVFSLQGGATLISSWMLMLLTAGPALPDVQVQTEDYFIVFAADAARYNPARAHTFAAMVRIERSPDGAMRVVSTTSLSWLPAPMKVRAMALLPETGRNVPLVETLQWSVKNGDHINAWGPYRVTPEFAETFRTRVRTVEDTFEYKGACLTSPKRVCDCARSIEEMIHPVRRYIGAFGYGAAAGSYIVRKFTPWFVEAERSHPWVGKAIGLEEYPIHWRAHGDFSDRGDQLRASTHRK